MKILITELSTLPIDIKERLSQAGLEVDYTDGSSCINPTHYDVVYGQRPFVKYPYDSFTNLKMLQLSSAGIDHLPVQHWLKDQVLISNARGVYSAPIAEMIVMSILMAIKQIPLFMTQQNNAQWIKHDLRELGMLKVLFLGTGNIAKETAHRLKPFGPLLIGLNSNGRAIDPFNITGKLSEHCEYLRSADIVINTLPYTKETHHLMNDTFFSAMKAQTIFINIGRGKSVDETALLNALNSDTISFAYLDVFEQEPLPAQSPLWMHPKVLITPHNSGSGQLVRERNYTLLLNNLQHYLKKEPLEHQL